MKHNLLVWTAHSCRRDVFLEELERGSLPNYGSLVERGLFFPSAVVGGHFQRTSNVSEITGRPYTSPVHPRENILNAAQRSGAFVGVVQDFVITKGAQDLLERGVIESVDEIYPRLIERPQLQNLGYPKLEFLPDLSPSRWLYWYRERATHRHFYNFALGFKEDGGLFEDVVNENPAFVRDQQRYSLRLQDQWLGTTLRWLEEGEELDETVLLIFSSHGTSLEGWLPLMGRVTRGNVDHSGLNFHPHVSHAFAILSGPGIEPGERDDWISIMDLKPTLCRLLGLEDLGGSAYEIDLLGAPPSGGRVLADVSGEWDYSLFDTETQWLYMTAPHEEDAKDRSHLEGLPTSPDRALAFRLADDPGCASPRTREFLESPAAERVAAEATRLGLGAGALLSARKG